MFILYYIIHAVATLLRSPVTLLAQLMTMNSLCSNGLNSHQHLVESMPRRIKAVMAGQTSTSKVFQIKWPVRVYVTCKVETIIFNLSFIITMTWMNQNIQNLQGPYLYAVYYSNNLD